MLEIKNICKTYRPKKGVPVQALKNVSLKFTEKGMVFILGKSGCGKSTLLNAIGGLDTFDSGELIIKGKSSKDFKGSDFDSYRNTFIGFIFQEYNILSEFNVEKNIALALELQGKKATPEKVAKLLEKVDLTDQGKRKTNELSGGQKQRIAIARALIKDPEIIIADEPTGALDSTTGKQVFDTLKKLSEDKLVIVVSHDREFAEIYGDRIIEMKDGVVISDETKRHIQGQKLNEGISVIGEDVIHIEAGHEVTQKELEFLTKYLQKRENSEAFISLNPSTNKKFREIAKIDDENASERFEDTTPEDLKTPAYNRKDLKLIRSRLKWKDSFKMGASGLKVKPVRLVLTILLSLVAFTLFALVDVLGSFNGVDNSVASLKDSNIKYLSFTKGALINNGKYNSRSDNLKLSSDDLEYLTVQTGQALKPVYAFGGTTSNSNIDFTNNYYSAMENTLYYSHNISGIVELTEAELTAMGCELIAGNYPKPVNPEIGGYPEIAITKYQLETFQKCGYKKPDSNIVNLDGSEVTANSIIGDGNNTIKLGDASVYRIVGVIDTKLDETRYGKLKDVKREKIYDEANKDLRTIWQELNHLKTCSIHTIMFVAEGQISSELTSTSQESAVGFAVDDIRVDFTSSYGGKFVANKSSIDALNQQTPNSVVTYYGNFNENSAVLPLDSIAHSFDYLNTGSRTYFSTTEKAEIQDTFNVSNEDINLVSSLGYFGVYRAVGDYNSSAVTFAVNFLKQVSSQGLYSYLTAEKYKKVWDCALGLLNDSHQVSVSVTSGGASFYYVDKNVSGMFYDSTGKLGELVIVGDTLYSEIAKINSYSGTYAYALGVMPLDDSKKMNTLLEFHFEKFEPWESYSDKAEDAGVYYFITNPVMTTMGEIVGFTSELSEIFLYIGLGLCLFASLMLMNFIAISIADKKREIGILRALGSRKSDVFGIFFNEALIIAFINFVLSTVATFVASIIINNFLRTDFQLIITVLNFSIRQIILIGGVSVLVAFLSSLIPVLNIVKKQPIDAINNR